MRIALVHSFYDPKEPSGENAVVAAQREELVARGHEVLLVARHTAELRTDRLYPLKAVVAAANLGGASPAGELSEFRPDVVHVHNLFPNWGTAWLKQWGSRTVVTLHNYRPVCANGLLWRDGHDCHECLETSTVAALRHQCYRNSLPATLPLAVASRDRGRHQPVLQDVARILVLNSGAKQLLAPLSSAPVEVLPNFVQAVDPLGVERSTSRLAYVGRLTPEKGILRLLDQLPDGHGLDILGDGPLRDEVAERADGDRIVFHGQQPAGRVREIMQSSTALVVPSLWSEGIPTTALEALSTGTPVLISRCVAAADDLTSGGAGLVYDPEDAGALTSALRRVCADPDTFSRAARRLHASRYSRQAWGEAMERVYREVVGAAH